MTEATSSGVATFRSYHASDCAAVTDAFSTALKMLGVAADIYAGRWDGSKYKESLPPQVEAVKEAFKGEVVQPKKQPAKLAFEPKGGETTAEEKKELGTLLSSKYADKKPVFSKDEIKAFSDMRRDYTAAEVIAKIKEQLQARTNPTATMKKASDLPQPVEDVKKAFDGEVVEAPSFDNMAPAEQKAEPAAENSGFEIC